MTPIRPTGRWALLLLLGAGLGLLPGCDSGSSKRASQSERLSGAWDVQCIAIDDLGCRGVDARLEVEGGGDVKSFRLLRQRPGDTTTAQGTIEVVGSNTLRMTGSFFPGTLVWDFTFDEPDPLSGSVRFRLLRSPEEESIRAFLAFLGLGEARQSVRIDLVTRSS